MAKYYAHIVSHSHWDREWYLTFEEFRIRLVDLIDKLLEYIDNDSDYDSFMFDGHTALIEDYLEVMPQNRKLLKRAIENGRIKIGPWYILPDEILVSGESHIRNYLIGDEICRQFGGKMNVGYLPDAFGHPSQIPQILKKLGLEEILFWRGLGDNISKNEFIWEAPDRSSILGIHLPFGYGNCPNMPDDPSAFLKRVEYVIERYKPTSISNVIPIMNGRDHLEAQEHITQMVRECSALNADIKICHSNLENYVNDLKESLEPQLKAASLERHEGELRSSDKTLLLGGTISTRMYLKQMNQNIQDLYEKWLEPFCTISKLLNASDYPQDIIRHGWKWILKNHPHDSICGCSIDEVHQEMVVRFNSARQIGDTMVGRALSEIIDADSQENKNQGTDSQDEFWIGVFNPSARLRTNSVSCEVDLYPRLSSCIVYEELRRGYFEDTKKDIPLPTAINLEDINGNVIPAMLESAEIVKDLRYYTFKQPHEHYFHRIKISFEARDIPALGYKMFKVVPLMDAHVEEHPLSLETSNSIENQHFRVEVDGAQINIFDKANDCWYYDCGALVDDADSGDEYTYSHVQNDFEVRSTPISVDVVTDNDIYSSIRLSSNLRLPVSVTPDELSRATELVDCSAVTKVTIYSNVPRIDFKVRFDNRAKDHRLRAHFPTDFVTEHSWAESAFCVDKRSIGAKQAKDGAEIFFTDAQKRFVSVDNGTLGVTIANKGLPEYEVIKTQKGCTVAITLLRCVAWLSKDKMLTRTGDAAWNIQTPDAQCLGEHVFEFSMIPHKGCWCQSKAYKIAHDYCSPLMAVQAPDNAKGFASGSKSLVSISHDKLILSAFKVAQYDSDLVILRFYNTGDKLVSADIKLGFSFSEAYLCDLKEEKVGELNFDVSSRTIKASANPWEIVTIALRPRQCH